MTAPARLLPVEPDGIARAAALPQALAFARALARRDARVLVTRLMNPPPGQP